MTEDNRHLNGKVLDVFTPNAGRRSRCPVLPRYKVRWSDGSWGWYLGRDLG